MSLADSAVLANDATFIGRVRMSMTGYTQTVANEGSSFAGHAPRKEFCAQILAAPSAYGLLFATVAAANGTVINEATSSGTVVLTTANSSTQQALALDVDINNAVASAYNSFIGGIL